MDWDTATVLEFVQLLKTEPVIWDLTKKPHKNRLSVNDAWLRIKKEFSHKCSVEELKRKRNSLMSAYREYLRKIKDSCLTATSKEDVYKPSWFAFETMHNFLGPVYEYQGSINTEISQRHQSRDSDLESGNESPNRMVDITSRPHKRRRQDNAMVLEVDEALMREKFAQVPDENDLFGQMLAIKLRKMKDEDRLKLTNEIQNLVFEYEIKDVLTSDVTVKIE